MAHQEDQSYKQPRLKFNNCVNRLGAIVGSFWSEESSLVIQEIIIHAGDAVNKKSHKAKASSRIIRNAGHELDKSCHINALEVEAKPCRVERGVEKKTSALGDLTIMPKSENNNPMHVHVVEHERDIHMYEVTEEELDQLTSVHDSIDFHLFILSMPIFVAFLMELITSPLSDRMFVAFITITLISFLGIIFFGFRAWKERKHAKQLIMQIKKSRI